MINACYSGQYANKQIKGQTMIIQLDEPTNSPAILSCRNSPNTLFKTCSVCHVPKLLSSFYKNNRAKDGRQSQCKECVQKKKRTKKFIYFIHDLDVNRIKIGYSAKLKNRVNTLLYGSSVCSNRELLYIIPGNISKEQILHNMFKEYLWNNKGSKEWFNNTDNVIIDFIDTLRQKNKKNVLITEKINYGMSLLK